MILHYFDGSWGGDKMENPLRIIGSQQEIHRSLKDSARSALVVFFYGSLIKLLSK